MGKLFDDYEDEEKEIETEETISHLERIQQILEESNIDYTESDDSDYDNILTTKNGIAFLFDEDGNLADIQSDYEEQ